MARARNIKPGFFKNEQLVELPFEYRLLFCGLWVLADREGRLEDRPKRIRMEIFPADDVDVQAGLEALSKSGFITRYLVAGQSYIQIDNFLRHQNPHHKEAESIIPEPEASPGFPLSSTKQQPEARLGQASDSEPVERGVNRADSLIPDSLIPDSNNIPPPAASERDRSSSENAVRKPNVFNRGIALLKDAGEKEGSARNFIGKLCADFGEPAVLHAIETAEQKDQPPVNPKAWLREVASKPMSSFPAKRQSTAILGDQPHESGWGAAA